MKKKLNKLAGFTLAELLIVVAIIGVLVAISIPIFTSRLEASRESTDAANLRSAYAAGTAALLTGKIDDGTALKPGSNNFFYDKSGKLIQQTDAPANTVGNAMRGKSTQNGYQGAEMTDFPGGVIFDQATNYTTPLTAPTANAGNSNKGPICVIINYQQAGGDSVSVFFGKDPA